MRRRRDRLVAVLLGLALLAVATPATTVFGQPAQEPTGLCRTQAEGVEHAMALPPGLLVAVGRVESGRGDPASHDVLPWPWTVNDEGTDHVFGSAFDAIAYVVAARGRGSHSLDVGCFQVNLQFHPDAFATVAEAFDPAANARYAGRLLSDLHAHSGSWETAVQLYHSATPWRGETYRDLVLSRWAETSLAAPPVGAQAASPTLSQPLPIPAALATNLRPTVSQGEAVRVGGRVVRVQYPTASGMGTSPGGRGRLPRVIVPSGAAPNVGH